jgi:hypothetical protein
MLDQPAHGLRVKPAMTVETIVMPDSIPHRWPSTTGVACIANTACPQ